MMPRIMGMGHGADGPQRHPTPGNGGTGFEMRALREPVLWTPSKKAKAKQPKLRKAAKNSDTDFQVIY
jgi:hypothetical protein